MEQMFEIDQARPEDAAQLLAYLKRVGSETDNLTFGAEGLPGTAEQEAAYLRQMLESPDDVQYVVRYRGTIVADGSLHRLPRRMSHRAEIGVSVVKECWGRGVGSALMEEMLAFAKQRGIRQLNLQVRSDNARAIRLYEKFGFQKTGTLPAFFCVDGVDVDFDWMNLSL